MPKKAIDYSKTIIYKLICKDENVTDFYVGSTTDFTRRKSSHKSFCNGNIHNSKNYVVMRENGGWENWKMIEIEKFPCNDSNEATAREQYWINELKANLNMIKAFNELLRENPSEYNRETSRKWRENNPELWMKINRENARRLYANNPEIVKERNREYCKKRVKCQCGKELLNGSLYHHRKKYCPMRERQVQPESQPLVDQIEPQEESQQSQSD